MEIVLGARKNMSSPDDIRPPAMTTNRELSDAEMNASYLKAYTAHPIDEPDAWGDLESFRGAIAR